MGIGERGFVAAKTKFKTFLDSLETEERDAMWLMLDNDPATLRDMIEWGVSPTVKDIISKRG